MVVTLLEDCSLGHHPPPRGLDPQRVVPFLQRCSWSVRQPCPRRPRSTPFTLRPPTGPPHTPTPGPGAPIPWPHAPDRLAPPPPLPSPRTPPRASAGCTPAAPACAPSR